MNWKKLGRDDQAILCYPRRSTVKDHIYCFCNGNNMDAEGFGVVELLQS